MAALVISTPMAFGLSEPSSSLDGPRPMKISRPAPENMPEAITIWPARSSKKSPRSRETFWMTKANRLAAPTLTTRFWPPAAMVWSTLAPVVLTAKPIEAPSAKSPAATATLPVRTPATPPVAVVVPVAVVAPAGKMMSAPLAEIRPWPLLPARVSPVADFSETLLRPILVTAGVPTRSKATSPCSTTPPMVRSTPSAATRRYGPLTSFRAVVFVVPSLPRKVMVSLTATPRVFTWTEKLPTPTCTGRLITLTEPENWPAMPDGLMSTAPWPPRSSTPRSLKLAMLPVA